jgi:hypothetical protein
MRKSPSKQVKTADEFIEDNSDKFNESGYSELFKLVEKSEWPVLNNEICSFADGSNLKRPAIISLNEKEWNTIETHTSSLGIPKNKIMKSAIFKTILEEQLYFLKNKK